MTITDTVPIPDPYSLPNQTELPPRAVSRFDRVVLICPQLGCNRVHGHLGDCSNERGRHRPGKIAFLVVAGLFVVLATSAWSTPHQAASAKPAAHHTSAAPAPIKVPSPGVRVPTSAKAPCPKTTAPSPTKTYPKPPTTTPATKTPPATTTPAVIVAVATKQAPTGMSGDIGTATSVQRSGSAQSLANTGPPLLADLIGIGVGLVAGGIALAATMTHLGRRRAYRGH